MLFNEHRTRTPCIDSMLPEPDDDDRLRCCEPAIFGLYNFITTSFSSPLSITCVWFGSSFVVLASRLPLSSASLVCRRVPSIDFISVCKSLSIGGMRIGMFDRRIILIIDDGLSTISFGGELCVNFFTTISESLSDSFTLEKTHYFPFINFAHVDATT